MYDNYEPQTTWPPSLVVSMSDYGKDGLESIPGWAHILPCLFSFFFFFVFMLNYFILVIWNYKNDKIFRSFRFYIDYVGVGVNLALLKNI